MERNHIEIVIVNVEGEGKGFFDVERFFAVVFDFYRAHDCIELFKNCVYEGNFGAEYVVGGSELEHRAVIAENCMMADALATA